MAWLTTNMTSLPILVVTGVIALVTLVAHWRIFRKLGVSGANALLPVWTDIRLTKEVCGIWMALLVTLLYCVSAGMVVYAYFRSITEPSTENRQLLVGSLGLGAVLWVLQGIVQFKLAGGLGKNYFIRVMMLFPCISIPFMWWVGFDKSQYVAKGNALETVGSSKSEMYARSGMYGQDNYNLPPLEGGYEESPVYDDSYDQADEYPQEPIQPQPQPEPVVYTEHEPITNEEDVLQLFESDEEISVMDEIDKDTDEDALANRPLYPGEKEKPKPMAVTDPLKEKLEEVLFDEEDEELEEAVMDFIKVWKEDRATRKERVFQTITRPKREEAVTVEEEKPRPKTSIFDTIPKKVDFENDDFWR